MEGRFDEWMQQAEEDIAELGYHMTFVGGDNEDPPFAYTTGLWQTWQHPELLTYGLSLNESSTILSAFTQSVRRGRRFAHGDIDRREFGLPIAFLDIPKDEYPGRLVVTMNVYPDLQFEALQVVTCDDRGKLPWEPGCDSELVASQPLLGLPPR